jgi:phage terminase large subunit-like protein
VEHSRRGGDESYVLAEYAAPEDCELDDETAWHAANPALGDFLYVDALRSTMRITREADFRLYRLGQRTQHAGAWLPREAWQACTDPRKSRSTPR